MPSPTVIHGTLSLAHDLHLHGLSTVTVWPCTDTDMLWATESKLALDNAACRSNLEVGGNNKVSYVHSESYVSSKSKNVKLARFMNCIFEFF